MTLSNRYGGTLVITEAAPGFEARYTRAPIFSCVVKLDVDINLAAVPSVGLDQLHNQ